MSTKSRFFNGIMRFFDSATAETVAPFAPATFYDDFLGKAINGDFLGTRDTAGGSEALVADSASGLLALSLTAAVEVQEAGIDWADNRTLVLNQGLVAEFVLMFTTLPASATIATIGLCGDYNADVDVVAESAWFRLDGSGVVTVESDDTANEKTKIATGVTLLANALHVFKIDCTDITSVKFYIDGAQVAATTTFDMSTVAALALQPSCRMSKAAAAVNLGVMAVDAVRIWQKRS